MSDQQWNVMVTGGAGYVGSVLVPKLLAAGHKVTVLDLFIYGDRCSTRSGTIPICAWSRATSAIPPAVNEALRGNNAVIHLACISNDPSFELDPTLGKSINYDCFRPLVRASKKAGIKRFIYASSSSVYGVKNERRSDRGAVLRAADRLFQVQGDVRGRSRRGSAQPGFVDLHRAAGHGLRLRAAAAARRRRQHPDQPRRQHRPHHGCSAARSGGPICISTTWPTLYLFLLQQDDRKIDGKFYNVGYENHSLMKIADIVKSVVGGDIGVVVEPTDDLRSYHVSSEKIRRELGFAPKRTIEQAVSGLVDAFKTGRLPNSLNDPRYFNIKMMQNLSLK